MRPSRTWWPTSRHASSVPTDPSAHASRGPLPGSEPIPTQLALGLPGSLGALEPSPEGLTGLRMGAFALPVPKLRRTARLRPRGAPVGWIPDRCLPYNVGAPRTAFWPLFRGLPSAPKRLVEPAWKDGGSTGQGVGSQGPPSVDLAVHNPLRHVNPLFAIRGEVHASPQPRPLRTRPSPPRWIRVDKLPFLHRSSTPSDDRPTLDPSLQPALESRLTIDRRQLSTICGGPD